MYKSNLSIEFVNGVVLDVEFISLSNDTIFEGSHRIKTGLFFQKDYFYPSLTILEGIVTRLRMMVTSRLPSLAHD